jgi:hypothetical protein
MLTESQKQTLATAPTAGRRSECCDDHFGNDYCAKRVVIGVIGAR